MRILMISSTFPYPPSRGGTEIRTFNLLKHLHLKGHEIALVTQRQEEVSDTEIEALRSWVDELVIFPMPELSQSQGGWMRKVRRFASSWVRGTPPNVLHRYSPEIQAWVDAYIRDRKCEVITCEHSVNAAYLRQNFRTSVQTVVNIHSLAYSSVRNHLSLGTSENVWRDRLYLSLIYRYEKRFGTQFSRMVVTTEDDQQQLLELCPDANVWVIPNGVDLDLFSYRSQDPNGHQLIFVGAMDASQNIDAVHFFCLEVLPILRQRYPDTTFSIVGARPAPDVLELKNCPGVTVTGRVPSMVDYLHKATVCVIPMRTGFGIKNKTLEAMAAGTPVVASDRGLEGLAVDGENVPLRALRANQVDEYVEAISRLFEDPQLRQQLSENGRSLIEQNYTWERAGECYEQVLLGYPAEQKLVSNFDQQDAKRSN